MSQGNIGVAGGLNPTRAGELDEPLGKPKPRRPLSDGNQSNAGRLSAIVRRRCCPMEGAGIGRHWCKSRVACLTIRDAVAHRHASDRKLAGSRRRGSSNATTLALWSVSRGVSLMAIPPL